MNLRDKLKFWILLSNYIEMVVSGVSPLSIPKAKANGLMHLKAFGGTEHVPLDYLSSVVLDGGTEHVPETYIDSVTAEGKCEQASTPTPTSPVDIWCNNGVLKLSPNLFNKNTPDVLLEGFPNAAGAWTVSNNFRSIIYQLTEGQTYTITRVTSTPTSAAMRVMAYSTNNLATANVQVLYVGDNSDKVATITVPSGYPYVLTYVKHSSDVITNQELLDGFQIEKGSMATPYHAYGSVYADGTQETVTDANGNVANCEMLLGVSTYKDTQELLTGAITRNIETLVFDGSENWVAVQTGTTNIQFRLNNVINGGTGENLGLITHFETVGYASNPDTMSVGIYLQPAYNRLYVNVPLSVAADLTAWQQWLADQYNAGTPIILVYPLATATTESVAGQSLIKAPVTAVGSIADLVATAVSSSHTAPTPTQPLDINTNNGVLKVSPNIIKSTVQSGSANDVNWTVNADKSISITGTASAETDITIVTGLLLKAGEYTISGCSNGGAATYYFEYQGRIGNQWVTMRSTNGASTVTYSGDVEQAVCRIRINSGQSINTTIYPQIEKGSRATPYVPYGEIYTDGTQEVVTDAVGNTASAEMLLALSTYKDTQDVISGAITRNVAVKVLNGTENWSTYWQGFRIVESNMASLDYGAGLCSHFQTKTSGDSLGVRFGANNNQIMFLHITDNISGITDMTTWKQWLADQYNAGTPVILVYPLATATTESVSPQVLTTEPITQTAGSISGLGITATESTATQPTPTRPLDIRCNNGVLEYGAFYQQMNAADYSDWVNTTTDGTAQVVDGSMVYTVTQEPTGNFTLRGSPVFPLTADNKLYVTFDVYLSRSASGGQVSDNNGRITNLNTFKGVTWDNANVWQTVKLSASANAYGRDFQSQCYPLIQTSGWTIGDYWKIRNYRVYDLTAIFGAGNEPTTLADIEAALFGVYPVGTVETIQVTGKNLFDVSDYNEESDWQGSGYRYVEIPLPNGTYTVSWDKTKGGSSMYWLIQVTESVVGTSTPGTGGSWLWHALIPSLQEEKFTFTVTEGKAWFTCSFGSHFDDFLAALETAQIELGSTATDYAPYFNGGTATAEMLLKVGNYIDEQEVISGAVTHKVGTKVLDGSEDVMIRSEADKRFLVYGIASNAVDGGHIICTHFSGGTRDNLDTTAVGEISAMSSAAGGRFSIRFSDISTVAGVKQWFTDQYNAGTPVMLVYPVATPTTESVAGQALQVTDGDNVAEITQASMSGLRLEAKYKKKP